MKRPKYIRTFSNDHYDYTKTGGVLCSPEAGNFLYPLFPFSQVRRLSFAVECCLFPWAFAGCNGRTERNSTFWAIFTFLFLACIWMTSLPPHFVFSLWFVLRLLVFLFGDRLARKMMKWGEIWNGSFRSKELRGGGRKLAYTCFYLLSSRILDTAAWW
mgnify:FL=1